SALITAPTIPLLGIVAPYFRWANALLYCCHVVDNFWHVIVPFEHSGKAFLAGFLGAIIWLPMNTYWDEDDEIDRIVKDRGDPLEVFLRTALGKGKPVMLTVKNGKVYVGMVFSTINPSMPFLSVLLLPIWSGYRSDDSKTVVVTTRYIDALIGIEDEA